MCKKINMTSHYDVDNMNDQQQQDGPESGKYNIYSNLPPF